MIFKKVTRALQQAENMYKAGLYQQSNSVQKRDAIVGLEKHAPKMKWKKNNNRIIDLGCGDGSVTNILKKYLPTDFTLVGADISEPMVRFATENNCDKQTSFTVLDIAGDLPEAMKANFEHVFSNYALQWVHDQKKAFKNIFNLLVQDGECFIIFLAHHPVFEVYRTLSRDCKWSTWVYDVDKYISPYHDSQEPNKEIIQLMENIGFVDIDVKCEDKVFLYDDIAIMKKHMMAINPFPIPKDKCDDYMEDYIQVLKDIGSNHTVNHNDFPEGITVHYKLLTVYGCKPSNIE